MEQNRLYLVKLPSSKALCEIKFYAGEDHISELEESKAKYVERLCKTGKSKAIYKISAEDLGYFVSDVRTAIDVKEGRLDEGDPQWKRDDQMSLIYFYKRLMRIKAIIETVAKGADIKGMIRQSGNTKHIIQNGITFCGKKADLFNVNNTKQYEGNISQITCQKCLAKYVEVSDEDIDD